MKNPLGPGPYGAFVGLAAIALVIYVVVAGFETDGPGAKGLRGGDRLPPFAALLATAQMDCDDDSDPCDANVARKAGSGQAGRIAACDLRSPKLLNSCRLVLQRPVVLGFFVTRGGNCESDMDVLDDVRRRHPGVAVAAVGIKTGRDDLRDLIRDRRWTFPVAWDRDGAVANLYGIAVCPQFVLARYGGAVQGTAFGALGRAEMERRVRRLEAASRRAGWKPGAATG